MSTISSRYCLVASAVSLILAIGLLPGLESVQVAQAASFSVPPGDVSALIAAINAANDESANPGPDTINLAAGSTYVLSAVVDPNAAGTGPTGLPPINSKLTINGNGSTITRDAAAPEFRFFVTFDVGASLTLKDLSLTAGRVTGPLQWGGAIYIGSGNASLDGVIVSGNAAEDGGGLVNAGGGTVTISGSTISGNSDTNCCGAGIFNGNGTMTITDSTITGNAGPGGGIGNGATLTINHSTISSNTGGGLTNTGIVTLDHTDFLTNTSGSGGAIFNTAGSIDIDHSTFMGNTSPESAGGAIYNSAEMNIDHSSFSNNSVGSGFAAAIYNGGTMTIDHGTFSNNVGEGDDIYNVGIITIRHTTVDGVPMN